MPGSLTGIQGQIWWGSTPIAYRDIDGSTYFQQGDWLGTQRLLTNYAGSVVSAYTSRPWGEAYASTGKDDNISHYAGLEQSENTGIQHATYRDYDSSLGRWQSPDSYTGSYDFTNPQSFNRFTYVGNQPNGATDPGGLVRTPWGNYADPGWGGGGFGWGWDEFVLLNETFGRPGVATVDSEGYVVGYTPGTPGNPDLWGLLTMFPEPGPAPSNGTLTPQAQTCENKIQGAVNSALNTNSNYLGPTTGPGMDAMGFRNGAYNFNYFAPGVVMINSVPGSTNGSGRFPGSGLHIPLPGGADPTISPWGYNAAVGGSYFTAHFDTANPLDDLVSLFEHFINDVLLRRNHGC